MAKINGNEAPEAITKIQLLTKTSSEETTHLEDIQLEQGEPLFDPNNSEGKHLHIGIGENKISFYDTEEIDDKITALIGTDDDTETSNTIKGAKEYTDSEIDSLNYTDTAQDNKFVTAVSQAKGIIEVTRRALEADDIPSITHDKISDFETSVKEVKVDKAVSADRAPSKTTDSNNPSTTPSFYFSNQDGFGIDNNSGLWRLWNIEHSSYNPDGTKQYSCDLIPSIGNWQSIGSSTLPVNNIFSNNISSNNISSDRIHSKNFDLSQTGLYLANNTSLTFNEGNGEEGEENWFSISKGDTDYAVLACDLGGTDLVVGSGITAIYDGHQIFNVSSVGQVTAGSFNAKSDAQLKENFQPLKTKKSILDLPTYKFDFIDGLKNQIGCKAQDLQEICPEIVDEGTDGYLSIQESKIVYLLLEEVKKLRKEIDELKEGLN